MRIIKRVSIKEYILSLFILMPYVEFGPIYRFLSLTYDSVLFRAGQVILISSSLVLAFIGFRKRQQKDRMSTSWLMLIFLLILIPFRWFFIGNKDIAVFLCQYLNFALPIIFAFVFTQTFKKLNLCSKSLFRYILFNFVVYSTVILLYNIIIRKVLIDRTIRLHGPGGGAVIYGYTVALMIVYVLCIRKLISTRSFVLSLLVLFATVFATDSRAAIALSVSVLLLYLALMLPKRTVAVLALVVATGILLLNFTSVIEKVLPRFFSFEAQNSTNARVNTIIVSSNAVFTSNALIVLFGMGFSAVFPYLRWLTKFRIDSTITNQFKYNGGYMLVQPHNSLIYLLHETGVIGASLFIISLILMQIEILKDKKPLFISVFLWSFFIVNLFDSIIIIHPLASAVMWTLLFIMIRFAAVPIRFDSQKVMNGR